MATTFIRKKEDFTCEKCGAEVKGTGFTNHCPHCLWSKHVDVFPGDRAEKCGGLMKPARVEGDQSRYMLVHVCETCGVEKRNKVEPEDNFDAVVAVARLRKLP